jgi:hypothetical protein
MTDAPLPAQRQRRKIAQADRVRFLEAVAHGWTVTHAAERAGFSRQEFYKLRERDEAFAAAWAEARQQGCDVIEDEMRRRAVDGYDEDTTWPEGELIRRAHRYDRALLQTLAKGLMPGEVPRQPDRLGFGADHMGARVRVRSSRADRVRAGSVAA